MPKAGLVYTSLVYASHLLLLLGMNRLAGKKRILPEITALLIPSFYSIILLYQLSFTSGPHSIPYWMTNSWSLTIIPVLSVKTVLLYSGIRLSLRAVRDEKKPLSLLLVFFLLLVPAGQIADGLFYAFEPLRYLTLFLSAALPYAAYLIFLPIIISRKYKENLSSRFDGKLVENFCRQRKLNAVEMDIIRAIIQGKSNKEIAFDNNTTLSIIKHRIFNLYKKCGINSRWELINLLVN